MNSKFQITRSIIQEMHGRGLTMPRMAQELTERAGRPITVSAVRNAYAFFNLDAKKKPRETNYELVNDETQVREVVEETENPSINNY